ncbi:MAG: hypothetical protein ACPG4U_06735 [Pseudomonadales bacterium]
MNEFTLDELAILSQMFQRANLTDAETQALSLQQRVDEALEQRRELDEMDFDDCLGGGCKL